MFTQWGQIISWCESVSRTVFLVCDNSRYTEPSYVKITEFVFYSKSHAAILRLTVWHLRQMIVHELIFAYLLPMTTCRITFSFVWIWREALFSTFDITQLKRHLSTIHFIHIQSMIDLRFFSDLADTNFREFPKNFRYSESSAIYPTESFYTRIRYKSVIERVPLFMGSPSTWIFFHCRRKDDGIRHTYVGLHCHELLSDVWLPRKRWENMIIL